MAHWFIRIVIQTTPMSVVQEMLTAIIDAKGWFGPGVSCAEEAKMFPIAFADFVKKCRLCQEIQGCCRYIPCLVIVHMTMI